MLIRIAFLIILLTTVGVPTLVQSAEAGGSYTVLVVMSYEKGYPWCQDMLEGIKSVFGKNNTVIPFYMNTKIDFEGGPDLAQKAYQLYLQVQPDGVIAADDNAQSMFVVPYLRNKVKTPVMFCGVNSEPEEYGYPAANVSGILERLHFTESIMLAKRLVPTISNMAFIMQAGPSAEKIIAQLQHDKSNFPVRLIATKTPTTVEEAVEMTKQLRTNCDLLFMETLQGLKNSDGSPVEYNAVMPLIAETFGKVVIASDDFVVRHGALCAVVKSGQEQGRKAAEMLLKAMQGEQVSNLPITKNFEGKRMINVTVMRRLGITPPPDLIRTSELVKNVD